jgi:hypothetical protein
MASLISRLHRAQAELDERRADPWRKKLRAAIGDTETISTAALLDILRVPATTGNARRLAVVMRDLGFVALKSRRLLPGGFRDTTARGWTRPVLAPKRATGAKEGAKVGRLHLVGSA